MVTRQDLESASFNERQRRMKKRWGPPENVMVR